MLELTENLKNAASLYIEDKEAWKDVNRVKNWLSDIYDSLNDPKFWLKEDVIERAFTQLENIYTATKTRDLELIRKELTRLFNIFTLACWYLTTVQEK